MDAIALLTADHNQVRGLFARFEAAHEAESTEEMSEVASRIIEMLKVHTTIEEEIFYPEIKAASDEMSEMVAEGVEEHGVVDRLMPEIEAGDPTTEEWAAKVKVLMENVEHHAGEEESDMFPKVRSIFSDEALTDLADRLTARKKTLGAPIPADTADLTKAQLIDLAREQGIPGRSSMDRDELAATVDPRG